MKDDNCDENMVEIEEEIEIDEISNEIEVETVEKQKPSKEKEILGKLVEKEIEKIPEYSPPVPYPQHLRK